MQPSVLQEMGELKFGELNIKRAAAIGVPIRKQRRLLLQRAVKAVSRNPFAFRARIGQAIFFGTLTNFVYWGVGGQYDPVGV